MIPGVNVHPYRVFRVEGQSDEEGNPKAASMAVGGGTGYLGVLSAAAKARAEEVGQSCDAALETTRFPAGARAGDMVDCRGKRWTVVSVNDLRSPVRVLLYELLS